MSHISGLAAQALDTPAGVAGRGGGRPSAAGRPAGRTRPRGRLDWACFTLLLTLAVTPWLPRLDGPLDLRYDSGVYYVLGTSLAEGKGYRLLNEPGEIQAIQYPPLLPLAAAAAQQAAGTSATAQAGHLLRLVFGFCFVLYAAAVYLLARRLLSPFGAWIVGLVTVLHPHMVFLSDQFSAELPFGLVSVAFVLAAERARAGRGWAIVAGFLAVAAYLLRTMGLALLAAWVGEALLARHWRSAAARAIVAALPVLAWQGYIAHVKSGPEYARPAYAFQRADYQYHNVSYLENLSYVDPFAPELGKASSDDWARRVAGNLVGMPLALGEAVSAARGWWADFRRELEQRARHASLAERTLLRAGVAAASSAPVALVLLGALSLAGVARLARRGERLIPLYVGLTLLLLSLTPWPSEFVRYLAPLTPFLALALVILLGDAWRRAARSSSRGLRLGVTAATALFVLGLAAGGYGLTRMSKRHHEPAGYVGGRGELRRQRLFFYGARWQSYEAALEWLRGNARASEIVASQTPAWTYLWTGLVSIFPPAEADPDRAQRLLDDVPVSYLVLYEEPPDISARQAEAVARAHPERWQLAYRTSDGVARVYRRQPAADERGAGSGEGRP